MLWYFSSGTTVPHLFFSSFCHFSNESVGIFVFVLWPVCYAFYQLRSCYEDSQRNIEIYMYLSWGSDLYQNYFYWYYFFTLWQFGNCHSLTHSHVNFLPLTIQSALYLSYSYKLFFCVKNLQFWHCFMCYYGLCGEGLKYICNECIVPMMSEILVIIKSSGNNSALDQKYVHKTIQTERAQIQQGPNQNFLMYVLLDSSLIINVQTYQQVFVGRCCINEWICSSKEICSEIMWLSQHVRIYCHSAVICGLSGAAMQLYNWLRWDQRIFGTYDRLLMAMVGWWDNSYQLVGCRWVVYLIKWFKVNFFEK